MFVKTDIKDKTYIRFIGYAVSKSDVFMLVSIEEAIPFCFEDQLKTVKEIIPNFSPDQDTLLRLKLMKKENQLETEQFEKGYLPFIRKAEKPVIHNKAKFILNHKEVDIEEIYDCTQYLGIPRNKSYFSHKHWNSVEGIVNRELKRNHSTITSEMLRNRFEMSLDKFGCNI